MPFISSRPKLRLTAEDITELNKISRSRTENFSRNERARILLAYFDGETVSAIAKKNKTN